MKRIYIRLLLLILLVVSLPSLANADDCTDPTDPNCGVGGGPQPVPIDGGISLLLAAAAGAGIKTWRDNRKKANEKGKEDNII